MKEQILKVAQDLEKGTITEDKARSLLLLLFGVSGSLPFDGINEGVNEGVSDGVNCRVKVNDR